MAEEEEDMKGMRKMMVGCKKTKSKVTEIKKC